MRLPLALALLVAAPALSGCFGSDGPAERSDPPLLLGWVPLLAESTADADRVHGFVVPPGAAGLRLFRAENATQPASYAEHPFDRLPPAVSVFDPSGTRVVSITPDARVGGTPLAGLLHHDAAPDPGVWRIVRFGGMPIPAVEVRTEAGVQPLTLFPEPVVVARRHLGGEWSAPSGDIRLGGEVTNAPGTLLVWGSLIGAGRSVRLILTSEEGDVDQVREEILARTPGRLEEFTFTDPLLGETRLSHLHPELLGGGLEWSLSGQGSAAASLWSATSPPRAAVPVVGAPIENASAERVSLSGLLDPRKGAAIDVPAQAGLFLAAEDDRSRAAFRLYSADGTLLSLGPLDKAGTHLPLGLAVDSKVVLVNDGYGRIRAETVGGAPADATLHMLPVIETVATGQLVAGQRYGETVVDVTLPGPVLSWNANQQLDGSLTDVFVQAEQGEAVQGHAMGDADGPEGGCCPFPFVTSAPGEARLLHGGAYTLRMSATSGSGGVEAWFWSVDLSELSAEEETDEAGIPLPDLPGAPPQLP